MCVGFGQYVNCAILICTIFVFSPGFYFMCYFPLCLFVGSPIHDVMTFSESKTLCFLAAVLVSNPRVYTHAEEGPRTHVKDPVVHVKVRWVTETRKDPACTSRTG